MNVEALESVVGVVKERGEKRKRERVCQSQ